MAEANNQQAPANGPQPMSYEHVDEITTRVQNIPDVIVAQAVWVSANNVSYMSADWLGDRQGNESHWNVRYLFLRDNQLMVQRAAQIAAVQEPANGAHPAPEGDFARLVQQFHLHLDQAQQVQVPDGLVPHEIAVGAFRYLARTDVEDQASLEKILGHLILYLNEDNQWSEQELRECRNVFVQLAALGQLDRNHPAAIIDANELQRLLLTAERTLHTVETQPKLLQLVIKRVATIYRSAPHFALKFMQAPRPILALLLHGVSLIPAASDLGIRRYLCCLTMHIIAAKRTHAFAEQRATVLEIFSSVREALIAVGSARGIPFISEWLHQVLEEVHRIRANISEQDWSLTHTFQVLVEDDHILSHVRFQENFRNRVLQLADSPSADIRQACLRLLVRVGSLGSLSLDHSAMRQAIQSYLGPLQNDDEKTDECLWMFHNVVDVLEQRRSNYVNNPNAPNWQEARVLHANIIDSFLRCLGELNLLPHLQSYLSDTIPGFGEKARVCLLTTGFGDFGITDIEDLLLYCNNASYAVRKYITDHPDFLERAHRLAFFRLFKGCARCSPGQQDQLIQALMPFIKAFREWADLAVVTVDALSTAPGPLINQNVAEWLTTRLEPIFRDSWAYLLQSHPTTRARRDLPMVRLQDRLARRFAGEIPAARVLLPTDVEATRDFVSRLLKLNAVGDEQMRNQAEQLVRERFEALLSRSTLGFAEKLTIMANMFDAFSFPDPTVKLADYSARRRRISDNPNALTDEILRNQLVEEMQRLNTRLVDVVRGANTVVRLAEVAPSLNTIAEHFYNYYCYLLDDFVVQFLDKNQASLGAMPPDVVPAMTLDLVKQYRNSFVERFPDTLRGSFSPPIFELQHGQVIALQLIKNAIGRYDLYLSVGTGQGKSMIITLAIIEIFAGLLSEGGCIFILTSYDHLAKRDEAFARQFLTLAGIKTGLLLSDADDRANNLNNIMSPKVAIFASVPALEERVRKVVSNMLVGGARSVPETDRLLLSRIFNVAGEEARTVLIQDEYDLLTVDLKTLQPKSCYVDNFLFAQDLQNPAINVYDINGLLREDIRTGPHVINDEVQVDDISGGQFRMQNHRCFGTLAQPRMLCSAASFDVNEFGYPLPRQLGVSGSTDGIHAQDLAVPGRPAGRSFAIPFSQDPRKVATPVYGIEMTDAVLCQTNATVENGSKDSLEQRPVFGGAPGIGLKTRRVIRPPRTAQTLRANLFTYEEADEFCRANVNDTHDVSALRETSEGRRYERPVLNFVNETIKYSTVGLVPANDELTPEERQQVRIHCPELHRDLERDIGANRLVKNLLAIRLVKAFGVRRICYAFDNEDEKIPRISRSGTITLASIRLGRGANIVVESWIPDSLHVIVATKVLHERVFRQLVGRTGRNGLDGTYSRIILERQVLAESEYDARRRRRWHNITRLAVAKLLLTNPGDLWRKQYLVFSSCLGAHGHIVEGREGLFRSLFGLPADFNVVAFVDGTNRALPRM